MYGKYMGAINKVSCEGLCCCLYCYEKISDVEDFGFLF